MDTDGVFALIAAERRRAASMFGGLSDDQRATQSLCTEWTVREIAAHLVGPFCVSVPRFLAGAVVSGGFHSYSVKATRRPAQRPTAELVALLRDNAERDFVPPGTGVAAPLTDLAVHTRDAAAGAGHDRLGRGLASGAGLPGLAARGPGFARRGRLADCGCGPPTRSGRPETAPRWRAPLRRSRWP